jgi:hypothetical protein
MAIAPAVNGVTYLGAQGLFVYAGHAIQRFATPPGESRFN